METQTTIEKAVDVLFHLHHESAARGVTDIGRALGLPKSSTHRLLVALGRRGLVEKDDRGRYRPGIGLIALGLGALDREPVVVAARPILETEADSLGETVFLVAARAGRIVVLDKVEGSGFLRAAPRVGSTVPVHATAVGKLYLAFGAGVIENPKGELDAFSDHTLTDAAALKRDVARAAKRGFAQNSNEWIAGLSVIAAPVFGSTAGTKMVAAVAVGMTSERLRVLGEDAIGQRAMDAAARIAGRLSGVSQ
jgi:DNA-binding IclR family transcriptional regulator